MLKIVSLAATLLFFVFSPLEAKVYDCFLFFNELELLEIRLHEMNEFVDHFVLVESTETFRGNPKPLYFSDNQDLFAKYKDKIIHVVIDNHYATGNPWDRESYQRNQIARGLGDCHADDIVLVSDLDEIIRRSDGQRLIQPLVLRTSDAVTAVLRFSRWQLNRLAPEFGSLWNGTVATTFAHFKRMGAQGLRDRKDYFPQVWHAGWHFTNMGGVKRVIPKIESTSHSEVDIAENKEPARLQYLNTLHSRVIPVDETFPRLVLERKELYESWGFLEPMKE